MQIFIKTLIGKLIVVDVEPSDTICRVKDLVLDKEGIPLQRFKLVYTGIPLACEYFPRVRKEFSSNRHVIIGSGTKSIRVLFSNEPNFFFTFRFSQRQGSVRNLVQSFVQTANEILDCDITDPKYNLVNLYCGDQLVCSYGSPDVIHPFRQPSHLIEDDNGSKCLDYYFARNDIWSIFIQNFESSNIPTLSDYNISRDSTLHLVLDLRETIRPGTFGLYSPISCSKKEIGINLCGICSNEKYSTPIQERESFDFYYDDDSWKCPSCQFMMRKGKRKCLMRDCHWKYSAIIRNRYTSERQRIQNEWKLIKEEEEDIFDPETLLSDDNDNLERLQIQVRFYQCSYGTEKRLNPDGNCVYCNNLITLRYDYRGEKELKRKEMKTEEFKKMFESPRKPCDHDTIESLHPICNRIWGNQCLKCQAEKMNHLELILDDDEIERIKFIQEAIIEEDENVFGGGDDTKIMKILFGGGEIIAMSKFFLLM